MIERPAIFASAFHPHVGGVEELVRQLAIEQGRRGLAPLVLTHQLPKDLPRVDVVEGVHVRRYPFRVPGANIRQQAGWIGHGPFTHAQVANEVRHHHADLIHVQCVSNNTNYALTSARSLRLPLVVTMQGELSMDANRAYERSSSLRRTWRKALRRADLVTACSQYVLDEAEDVLGFSLPQSRVIYNGIRLEDYTRTPDPAALPVGPYVLAIGRMVEQKGFDLVIDAMRSLPDDVRLVLAGDGPSRGDLEHRVSRYGLNARVTFVGRVGHIRAVELFQGASAFVLSSRHEPQGIVVLEAMAAGAPVVAARVGGVPELVQDFVNGLLFEGGSSEGIAEGVLRVLSDAGLADRLAEAGRATASAHDWGTTTSDYLDAYAQASR